MKLHEKIKIIRREKNLTQQQLQERIAKFFGKSAIDRRTLQRIEGGKTDGRASSIHQICIGLSINLKDLYEGTESQEKTGFARWDKYKGRYVFNETAFAQLLSGRDMEFLCMKLSLDPEGKTSVEKDPEDKKYTKWLYILRGSLVVHVEDQHYLLKKNQCATFHSSSSHYFENPSKKKTLCLIMQYPRHI